MNESEKFWDNSASSYDQEEQKDTNTRTKIIEKTKKYLKTSDTVLDYGCGTGLITNEIAGNAKAIHAIDISSKMIEIAKNKSDILEIKNIDYVHSTIFDKRHKKGSFDAILCFYILHLLDDSPKVIQRLNELLKPKGLLISVTPCMSGTLLSIPLSLMGKIGLIPPFTSFRIPELEDLIAKGKFKIVETECLNKRGQQYFIVAKKL